MSVLKPLSVFICKCHFPASTICISGQKDSVCVMSSKPHLGTQASSSLTFYTFPLALNLLQGHCLLRSLLLNPSMLLSHLRLPVRGHFYRIQNLCLAYMVMNIHLLFLLWLLKRKKKKDTPISLGICLWEFLSLYSQKLMWLFNVHPTKLKHSRGRDVSVCLIPNSAL